MRKKNWFLSLSILMMLGYAQGEAGWVYQEEEENEEEFSYQDEVDLTESLGQVEEDLENEGVAFQEESLLPWGVDENQHEEFSAFIEERANQALREYEESFALESSRGNRNDKEQLPAMEDTSVLRKSASAERSQIAETKKEKAKQNSQVAKKRVDQNVPSKKLPKAKVAASHKKVESSPKQQALAKRNSPSTHNRSPGSPCKHHNFRSPFSKTRRSNTVDRGSRSQEVVTKKRQQTPSQRKRQMSANYPKRQRPVERLAQSSE